MLQRGGPNLDLNLIPGSTAGVVKVKNTARKSFPNSNRVNMSREDEKVIDELLADSSDEAEPEPKIIPVEPNNIVTFASAITNMYSWSTPTPSGPRGTKGVFWSFPQKLVE